MIRHFLIAMSMAAAVFTGEVRAQSTETIDPEILVVAATVYGEAYREGDLGMQAVLETIQNRAEFTNRSLTAVVLQRRQYSCWNDDSPSRALLRLLASGQSSGNPRIDQAFAHVVALVRAQLTDARGERILNRNVRHYWAPASVPNGTPYWYRGEPRVQIGGHVFAEGVP